MIDVSDGLGADAEHLAAASGAGIEIELERVPMGAGVREVAAARRPRSLRAVASGGEDYELLCAVPRAALEPLSEAAAAAGVPADRDRPVRVRRARFGSDSPEAVQCRWAGTITFAR